MNTRKRVYLDSCVLIELVKHKVGAATKQTDRANDVSYVDALLEAARANEIDVLTSGLSVVECISVNDKEKELLARDLFALANKQTEKFFSGLLESGRSGIKLIQPTSPIQTKARDLRWLWNLSLKGFDSVHTASALFMKCDELLTTDDKFFANAEKLSARGLPIRKPSDTKCLPEARKQQNLELKLASDTSSE